MNGALAPVLGGLFSGVVLTALIDFIRDYRSNRAKGEVAERTVEMVVDASQLENIKLRMNLMEQSFNGEREVLLATINHLKAQVAESRADSEQKDILIARLGLELQEVQARLSRMAAAMGDPDLGK